MPRSGTAVLPIAYITLRILIVLNWIYGVAIFSLLMPPDKVRE